eukprot:1600887-Prymnesium_polylepis.1
MASPCGRLTAIAASRSTASVRNAQTLSSDTSLNYLPFCSAFEPADAVSIVFSRATAATAQSPSCPT